MLPVVAAQVRVKVVRDVSRVAPPAVTDTLRGFGGPMPQFAATPSSRTLWLPGLIPWIVTTPLVGSDTGARLSTRTVYPLASWSGPVVVVVTSMSPVVETQPTSKVIRAVSRVAPPVVTVTERGLRPPTVQFEVAPASVTWCDPPLTPSKLTVPF